VKPLWIQRKWLKINDLNKELVYLKILYLLIILKVSRAIYIARPKKQELMRKSNFAMRPQKCIYRPEVHRLPLSLQEG